MSERFRSESEEDLARLRKMLRKVTADDAETVRKRLSRRDEARVLDLACGECREAEVLTDFLSELKGPSGEIKLTGMDVRAREIADAQRRFGGRREIEGGSSTRDCEFLTGDASKLDLHSELGDDFDLVFMRHQNYWNGAKTWEEIYDQALNKLGEDGRLIITSYFDKEHELALEAIQRLGGDLIRSEFNPETRALPTEGKSVDRHVAIFRKKIDSKMKVTVLVILGIVLLVVAMVYLGQGNLIYFPQRYSTKAKALQKVEQITYLSDGRTQSIYLYPKERAAPPQRVWWFFGGNGSVALNWVDLVAAAEPGVSQAYVLFDYPGYGFSRGRPSPGSISNSVDLSLAPVAEKLGLTVDELTQRSAAMGHSLGGAVALDTAGRHGFDDVVMVSPFTTMKEMARRQVGPVVSLVLTHHYDNEKALKRWMDSPRADTLTVFHGDSDRIIPVAMGRAIGKRAEEAGKGEFIPVQAAGHNDIIDVIGGLLVTILEAGSPETALGE